MGRSATVGPSAPERTDPQVDGLEQQDRAGAVKVGALLSPQPRPHGGGTRPSLRVPAAAVRPCTCENRPHEKHPGEKYQRVASA